MSLKIATPKNGGGAKNSAAYKKGHLVAPLRNYGCPENASAAYSLVLPSAAYQVGGRVCA